MPFRELLRYCVSPSPTFEAELRELTDGVAWDDDEPIDGESDL